MRRDEALAILAAHKDELARYHVKSLALFGSVARDEAGPDSDVDVLVEFDRPVDYFLFFELQEYLTRLLGREVDLGTPRSLREGIAETVLLEMVHVA
jgi:predicted nucleotidyltransferase